ncbi:MAG: B12-binding domain-containing radical SAM protein [Candidatus Hodarchaeota archaeon]
MIFPNTRRNSIFFPSIIQPPLGLAYLAAMIKDKHEIIVIDAAAENLKFERIFKKIEDFNPEIVGITTNISIADIACELAYKIKIRFRKLKIVLGGPWATSNYEYALNRKIADYVVYGEGEFVFTELLEKLENNENLDNIEGLAYLENKKVVFKPRTHFIENLDELPFPAWEYFPPSNKYFHHYRHFPLYPMMITRGCPYSCINCTKHVHGFKIRKRSQENVIREMKYLIQKFKVKEIIIVDDNFTFDVKYAESILDEIIKEKLNIHLLLPNGIRADTLTPKLLKKMRRAGVYGFAIGVESGVQSIVNKIGKTLDLNKVKYAANLAKKYGFLLRAFFILGLPYDSFDTMHQTIEFAKEINPHFAYFFIATLFPGTEMFDIVNKMGRVQQVSLYGKDEKKLDEHVSRNIGFFFKPMINYSIGKLKPGDVKRAYTLAVRKFYLRPAKILSIINTIRSISELKWIIHYFLVSITNIISNLFKKEN